MKPYQQRVLAERDYVAERLPKLRAFLDGKPEIDHAEIERLTRQAGHMEAYLAVLNERIDAFKPE